MREGVSGALVRAAFVLLLVWACDGGKPLKKRFCFHSRTSNQSIYDFEVRDVHDEHVLDWTPFRGKVMLLANVASF